MQKVEKFSARLSEAMNQRKIKASALSALTGISHVSISHYLHGKYEANAVNLQALASALLVDPLWLMGFNVPEEKPHVELQRLIASLDEEQAKEVAKYIHVFVLKDR